MVDDIFPENFVIT